MGKIISSYGLNTSLPFHVTRKHGDTTAAFSASLWMILLWWFMLWINVVLWGAIGVWKAFSQVF